MGSVPHGGDLAGILHRVRNKLLLSPADAQQELRPPGKTGKPCSTPEHADVEENPSALSSLAFLCHEAAFSSTL